MAFSLINKTIAASTATSGVVSPGWTMGAGHLVVAALGLETTTVVTAPTVTDSLGNTYTLRASQPTDSSSTGVFLFDSVLTTGGAGATITAAWGGASFKFALAVIEYSFANTLARDGTSAARSGAGTATMDPGSLVLTGTGRLVISAGEVAAIVAYTPASGYTIQASSNSSSQGHLALESATGQSGTVDPTIGIGTSHPWAAVAAAYYESTGGGSSMRIQRSEIPTNRTKGIAVDLTGIGTTWTSGTTFTVSGVSGCSKSLQVVISAATARVVVITGATTGTLTISDGTNSATVAVKNYRRPRWIPGL